MPLFRLPAPACAVAALTVSIPCTYAAEAPSDTASAGGPIEEIVVTARKRTESLQDAPVAVTAMTSDLLGDFGIQSLADISKMTAGLLFDSEFGRGSNRPVIRGQANILGASGVSYFIDGVSISGSIDDYDLDDVERIEIVKGPQSALYGRNTYSGAINIVTRSPGEEFRTSVKAEAANDGQLLARASLSGPMGGALAGGVTFRHYEMGGVTNEFDGNDVGQQQSRSVSGVLEYKPDDRLHVRARAYWAERDDAQIAVSPTRYFDNNCYPDDGALYGGAGRYFCGEVRPGAINMDWPVQAPNAGFSDDQLHASLRADYVLNDVWQLTYIAGFGSRDEIEIYDGDYLPTSFQVSNFTPNGFPFGGFADGPPFLYAYAGSMTDFTVANDIATDDWSQELQLSFDSGGVRGLLGAFHGSQDRTTRNIREVSDEQQGLARANWFAEFLRMRGVCAANFFCESMAPFFGSTIVVPRDVNTIELANTAVFGMASFDVSENASLTIEGRYQDESIHQHAVVQDLGGPADPPVIASAAFDGFLPRITLDWRPTDNHMFYVAYATGTKPGGFNSTVAIEAGIPTYEEEDARSIEIGLKSILANGSMLANLAVFSNELTGYQLTQNVRSGQNAQSATVNAGDADINGFEAELVAAPTELAGLTMRFNYAWTDARYTRGFDQNHGLLIDVRDDRMVNCSTGRQFSEIESCTGNSRYGSIAGKQVPRTAEHQVFADIEYRQPLSGGWEWFGGVSYVFESSKFAQVHNEAETGTTTLVNARLGFVSDRYAVSLWGRNLTGEDSAPNVVRYAEPEAFRRNFIVAPRRDTHYGLTLSARI